MIDLGAQVDVRNNFGITPLHLAIDMFPDLFIVLATAQGININTQDSNGDTILHKIIDKRSDIEEKTTMMDVILKRGANCNIANNVGR